MLFFFKEKPVEITAFVSERYSFAKNNNPVVPASKILPTWWKNTPSGKFNWEAMTPDLTVKSCMGILNTFSTGYIIPLWTDLALNITDRAFRYAFADEVSKLDLHDGKQAPGWYSDYVIMKINSPWLFKTSKNINLLYSYPWYHTSEPAPYLQPYGINEPRSGLLESHQFLLFKKEDNQIMIKSGTPFGHVIPLTEKKTILKTEIVSDQEYTRIKSPMSPHSIFLKKGVTLRKKLP